jgi:hypothetical protein
MFRDGNKSRLSTPFVAAKFELVAEVLGHDEEEMKGDVSVIALEESALARDVNWPVRTLCPS